MGLYMLVFAGGTPLGAPLVGWVSQEFGARWGLIGGGIVSAAAGPAPALRAVAEKRRRVTARTAVGSPGDRPGACDAPRLG